jgi:nucleoside-triphosphatase THEP1
MHIFLTGRPGVGKTTCIGRVIDALQEHKLLHWACGFYTAESRVDGNRVGFSIVCVNTSRREPLATVEVIRVRLYSFANVDSA